MLILALGDRQVHFFPILWRNVFCILQELRISFAQSNESDMIPCQIIQDLITGEVTVKDKGVIQRAVLFSPVSDKLFNLFRFFPPQDVGPCIENDIAGAVLNENRIGALHGLAPGPAPDLLHFRKLAEMSNGMEIKIDLSLI